MVFKVAGGLETFAWFFVVYKEAIALETFAWVFVISNVGLGLEMQTQRILGTYLKTIYKYFGIG